MLTGPAPLPLNPVTYRRDQVVPYNSDTVAYIDRNHERVYLDKDRPTSYSSRPRIEHLVLTELFQLARVTASPPHSSSALRLLICLLPSLDQ